MKSIDMYHKEIKALEEQISALKHDLEVIQAAGRDRGVWASHTSEALVLISSMQDKHIINAILCMERRDTRYVCNPERMVMFADLIKEACRRGLEWRSI